MWYMDVALAEVLADTHQREIVHDSRQRRLAHELRRLHPRLPLRVQRSQARRQLSRGAAGDPVHQGRPGLVAAVHLQRHASGTTQRDSPSAVRTWRHRSQQSDVSPERRPRRLLLGDQRLHGLRHVARLAQLGRVRRTAIPAGSASTATGTTSGSTGSWPGESASAIRRSATEPRTPPSPGRTARSSRTTVA